MCVHGTGTAWPLPSSVGQLESRPFQTRPLHTGALQVQVVQVRPSVMFW